MHCGDCGANISLKNSKEGIKPDADDIKVRLEREREAMFFEAMVVAASCCQIIYPRLFTDYYRVKMVSRTFGTKLLFVYEEVFCMYAVYLYK